MSSTDPRAFEWQLRVVGLWWLLRDGLLRGWNGSFALWGCGGCCVMGCRVAGMAASRCGLVVADAWWTIVVQQKTTVDIGSPT